MACFPLGLSDGSTQGGNVRSTLILGMMLALAGCGFSESRFNPINWFGNGKNEAKETVVVEKGDPALRDERPLVEQVTELQIERAAGGAIVRATGVALAPGYFGAELVPLAQETPVNGSLVYFFRVQAPETAVGPGPTTTRTLTVARFVPDTVLERARSIVVRGARNQRRATR